MKKLPRTILIISALFAYFSGIQVSFAYYEPSSQRWINRDPLGDVASLPVMTAATSPWADSDSDVDEMTGDEFIDAWTKVNRNLYGGMGNGSVNLVDPWGLDTFCQNRELNPKGKDNRKPAKGPITHTFVYTTNPDGSLKNTFSWGNNYDKNKNGVWSMNRPEDRSAANEAIKQRAEFEKAPVWLKLFKDRDFGPKVGTASLDTKVESAFQKKANDPNDPSRHPWELFNNCKHEAARLIEDSKKLP